MKNKTFYVVERLTVFSWIFYVLPHLIQDRLRGVGVDAVYFVDGTARAARFARLTQCLSRARVERLTFRIWDIRDSSGIPIRLRLAYQDFGKMEEEIIRNTTFQKVLRENNGGGRMPFYLIKRITASPLNLPTLWRALLLVQVARWKIHELQAGHAVLLMNRSLWRKELQQYASEHQVRFVPIKDSPRTLPLVEKSGSATYELFRLNGRDQSGGATALQPILNNRSPKLAVEYYGHLNLDHPEMHSDLFFWQKSEIEARDIVVVFHISRDPLDEQKWREIHEHGMEAVVLDSRATTLPNAPLFRSPECRRTLKFRDHWTRSPEESWLNRQIFYYETGRRYWADLFDRCGMKIFVSWYKYDATHCVIADAMQSVGGVTAIYQRAYEEFPSPETTLAVDVAFGFSPHGAEIERRSHSLIPYHVATGYIGDHRIPLLRKPAQDIRQKLMANGARRIIAFFDENSFQDTRWHIGHESLRGNYRFLLEKLLSNPALGLVFKPKVPATLIQRLGDVAELLKRGEATGRCMIIEGGQVQGSYPPTLAALAADVAVHSHLFQATAGLEAALAGIPTLLLDHEGWRVSPLYRLGVDRVVFTRWDDLWKACEEHWNSAGGIPGFGDWSAMLNDLDPFRDGRAAERIGTYLKWILDAYKSGATRETALADAADRYCRMWGRDKVTEVGDTPLGHSGKIRGSKEGLLREGRRKEMISTSSSFE